MTIGLRIRIRRQQLGLSQQELADDVGVSRGAVSQWESATTESRVDPRQKHHAKIAETLKTSVDWLLTGRDDSIQDLPPGFTQNAPARVQGVIGLGVWIESGAMPKDLPEILPPYPARRYNEYQQYAFRVDGDDLAKSHPGITYVYVVSISETGHTLMPGDVVLVENSTNSVVERSAWRVKRSTSELILESESAMEKAKHPIPVSRIEADPNQSIAWLAIGFVGDL